MSRVVLIVSAIHHLVYNDKFPCVVEFISYGSDNRLYFNSKEEALDALRQIENAIQEKAITVSIMCKSYDLCEQISWSRS